MTHTVQNKLDQRQKEREEAAKNPPVWQEDDILRLLPYNLPAPTVSNESETAFFGQPGAWLSFSRRYGEDWDSADVLGILENAGFSPMCVSLVKWDNYRRTAEPGKAEDIPETKNRYKLTDAQAIAPLWIEPCQHTGTSAKAFYQSPSGLILKVSVPGPSGVFLTARRVEYRGGWHFERGSARVVFPDKWYDVRHDTDRVATISAYTGAQVDTEQGMSGSVYFDIDTEQDEFPLTPQQMLRQLMSK